MPTVLRLRLVVLLAVTLVMALGLCSLPVKMAYAGSLIYGSYTNPSGTRDYQLYVPTSINDGKSHPLVVMLHGCSQDPVSFAGGTRMNTLAETHGFVALYPRQDSAYNTLKCWNWFEPAHQGRDSGEPSIIAGMVNQVKSQYNINNRQVYLAGMSAGAGMTAIMASCYPDVFAAAAVHSGLQYKAASNLPEALVAQVNGSSVDPDIAGRAAYGCSGVSRAVVPVVVFHGSADSTVNPLNGQQVVEQFAQMNDLMDDNLDNDTISTNKYTVELKSVEGGYNYTVSSYYKNKRLILQKYLVDGMGHAWSGGDAAYNYNDSKGPDASAIIWDFLSRNRR
ncbi:MAG: phaZ1 [Chloroflexi bacterium]|jgi:poly(hydroxyalkanoate) depolymerase family esterase|nr:phaZ1 [Chloroflexota bacterium]